MAFLDSRLPPLGNSFEPQNFYCAEEVHEMRAGSSLRRSQSFPGYMPHQLQARSQAMEATKKVLTDQAGARSGEFADDVSAGTPSLQDSASEGGSAAERQHSPLKMSEIGVVDTSLTEEEDDYPNDMACDLECAAWPDTDDEATTAGQHKRAAGISYRLQHAEAEVEGAAGGSAWPDTDDEDEDATYVSHSGQRPSTWAGFPKPGLDLSPLHDASPTSFADVDCVGGAMATDGSVYLATYGHGLADCSSHTLGYQPMGEYNSQSHQAFHGCSSGTLQPDDSFHCQTHGGIHTGDLHCARQATVGREQVNSVFRPAEACVGLNYFTTVPRCSPSGDADVYAYQRQVSGVDNMIHAEGGYRGHVVALSTAGAAQKPKTAPCLSLDSCLHTRALDTPPPQAPSCPTSLPRLLGRGMLQHGAAGHDRRSPISRGSICPPPQRMDHRLTLGELMKRSKDTKADMNDGAVLEAADSAELSAQMARRPSLVSACAANGQRPRTLASPSPVDAERQLRLLRETLARGTTADSLHAIDASSSMAQLQASAPMCAAETGRSIVPGRLARDDARSRTEVSNQVGSAEQRKEADASCKEYTTVMVRNLPPDLLRSQFLQELDTSCFANMYDFLYIPKTFSPCPPTGQRCFGFVNFVSTDAAAAFASQWHGSHRFNISQHEMNTVAPAVLQGLEANLAKWDTGRMRRVRNPEYRPFVRGAP